MLKAFKLRNTRSNFIRIVLLVLGFVACLLLLLRCFQHDKCNVQISLMKTLQFII